ncbi:MAG: leucine-rich repeat domain-containing protein [Saccharofermentans sp.]|nr:leucine-rich repeat domain-containing protein [Saccharofermentans sp.]
MEDNAFYKCRSLESIELNEGLESIGFEAFGYAEALTSIRIPSTVKSMQVSILWGSGVTDIYLPADLEPTKCELATFYNPDAKTRVHVTAGSWADTNYYDYFVNCGEKRYD